MSMRIVTLAFVALVLGLAIGLAGVSAAPTPALPPITIDQPADHGTVNNPVLVIFETPADLSKMTAGSDDANTDPTQPAIYLHIGVDSSFVMPTLAQLEQVGQNQYQYELPRLGPGFHEFKVFWGDSKTHRPVGRVTSVLCKVSNF